MTITTPANAPDPVDISSEEWRTYTYAGGNAVTIDAPQLLYVMPSGSHRIVDNEGRTHRPTPGYLMITWQSKPGQPAFVA